MFPELSIPILIGRLPVVPNIEEAVADVEFNMLKIIANNTLANANLFIKLTPHLKPIGAPEGIRTPNLLIRSL